jgi:site-specific DNA-methyltransferase (adenine-specific)
MKALFTSKSDQWATPQWLFDELNNEFCFTLDPCADDCNHKCNKYFTKEQNGLTQSWANEVVFCNPPYGREIQKWVKKWFEEVYFGDCSCAVMLIPSRTDTKYFHQYIYKQAEVRFIKGRLKFSGSTVNAPFPSMIVVFRKGGDRNVR